MDGTIDTLRDLASRVQAVVADAFGQASFRALSDAELVAALDAAGAVLRGSEALIAEAAGEVDARSESPERAERMSTRYGCRDAAELLERILRVSGRSARKFVRAGRAVRVPVATLTGQALSPVYPAMRAALADLAVGVDAVFGVTIVLDQAAPSPSQRAAADIERAASARGDGADGGGLPTADDLRLQAQVWAAYLDPDGAEPRDEAAQRRRTFTLGKVQDGLARVSGYVLADVAGQLQRNMDAILNPRAGGSDRPVFVDTQDPEQGEPHDPRTAGQKRHDALGAIVTVAARAADMPTLGGAAPTLLVSVRAEDLNSGRGVAHIDGIDEPVPLSVARHTGCLGSIFRVTQGENGRIEKIEVVDRVFTAAQRKALTLRDGECIIPGCHVPAAWTEIHHVQQHSHGGPTHVDNGVLLCWHHREHERAPVPAGGLTLASTDVRESVRVVLPVPAAA